MLECVAERLRLLADATRLRILNALREGESSGASQPNVPRHLALLLRAGIVARRPDGRQVRYRIVDSFIDGICEAICGSLRAHVDRQAQRFPITVDGRAASLAPRRITTTSPSATTRRRRT